ncbi:MAG: amidohydrolase family protein [bacterium]
MILTADCILPVSSPPLHHGAVAIQGSKILDVGDMESICRRYPDLPLRELKGCVLMPGLVNAHTHLELTLLRDRLSTVDDFISWLLALIPAKMKMTPDEIEESIRTGAEQSLSSGTTCIGEITNTLSSPRILGEKGLRGVVFLEVLGRNHIDPDEWGDEVIRRLRAFEHDPSGRITMGISPHTPYTLSVDRLQVLSGLLRKESLPYTIHVSESREEQEYFLEQSGGFKSRLFPAVGWQDHPDPIGALSPLLYLDRFGLVTDRLLIAHGVYLSPEDMDRIREAGARVVICAGSNQMLGVGRPPIRSLMQKNIPVALGTDSLASNTSLSLWDEMRHVYALVKDAPPITADSVLSMATLGGAQGLGLASDIGSIEPAKEADLIAVEWEEPRGDDPATDLISRTQDRHIRMVMVGGRIVKNKKI